MEDMTLKDPDLLSKEEIEELLPQLDGIISWAKQVQEYALTQALNGEHYDGFKVVEGRSLRTFTDQDKAADKLRAAGFPDAIIYEKKLLSLSRLESVVGKKKFAEVCGEYIEKPQGKPTLVESDDKRPEYSPNAGSADYDDGNDF